MSEHDHDDGHSCGHDHDHGQKHDHHHGPEPRRGDHHGRHQHGHHHHGHQAPADFTTAFALGILLNGGFVVAEGAYGFLAHSLALLADAGHNLGDVVALSLAWGAMFLGRRKRTNRFTYGLKSGSILAALANSMLLLFITGGIVLDAIQRLLSPSPVEGSVMMAVAALGIAINGFTAFLFFSGRKDDLNLRAAFTHMLGDAFVALGVVVAGVAIRLTGALWIDPVASLVISLVIILGTWSLLRESLSLALTAVPPGVDFEGVERYLSERTGVAKIHDLHIWALSTTETALTAHLVMEGGHPGDLFLRSLEAELRDRYQIHHTTVQIELGDGTTVCGQEAH